MRPDSIRYGVNFGDNPALTDVHHALDDLLHREDPCPPNQDDLIVAAAL